MKKKIISIMMTAVMIFSMSTAFSFAGDTSSKIIVNSSGDKLIPEDVAEIMAEYFIRDNLLGESVNWTEDTFISNSITMYDQNGNISAYSFELKTDGTANGYIVVSAYADLENHILEYSDSAEPVYKKLSLSSSSDKIVYLGGLEYYKDNGTETLMSVEQNPVSKDNVKNLTSELLLKTNNEKHAEISNGESGISLNNYGEYIEDPVAYANKYYGGSFSSYEYRNVFEDYCHFVIQEDMAGYTQNCGPCSITNTLLMYQSYTGSPVSNATNAHRTIAEYGISKGYFENHETTYWNTYTDYVEEAFSLFGYDVTSIERTASYNNVKYEIDNNDPIILGLYAANWNPYNNHYVVGYAYTRLKNTAVNYKSFIKIQDNHVDRGRYIDMGFIGTRNDATLYTVRFN